MNKIYDKETDLEWLEFYRDELTSKELLSYIKSINTWSKNPAIKRFIFETKNLGSDLLEYFDKIEDLHLFIAIKQDEPLITLLTSNEKPLARVNELKDYLKYQKFNQQAIQEVEIPGEQFLDFDQTFNMLKNHNNNENMFIEYIIANPKYHGKGLGTRALTSIKNNLEFFYHSKEKPLIQASVDNENKASRKMFLKNKFKCMKPCRKTTPYNIYYLSTLNLNNEKGQENEQL